MIVTLNNDVQQKIFEQMENTYPNEGGGFLLGEANGDGIIIKAITQVENVFREDEQFHRYAMTPQDWMRLEDQADEQGLTLVGYYHSHPNAPAIPSEYDRDHALPNFVYVITSVKEGKAVDMRVWMLKTDRSAFNSENLVVN
jgi:proteasome lid subunit RPN8/RPN11